MHLRPTFLRAGLMMLALSATPGFSQNDIPDAPKQVNPSVNTPATPEKRKWTDVAEPEETQPLSAGEKLMFPVNETLRLSSWFPTFFSAGWSHLRDSDPKYGSDSGAFGQRLGAAALRDLSMRTFADGVMPALLREDPRYFRMRDGAIMHRSLYAASRVFVVRRDSGTNAFNTSGILGRGMASALTMAYYPDKSANASVVFTTWGFALFGNACGNLWSEFWPDVRERHFFLRRSHDQP
jgi:hypothetical protein